MLTYEQALKDLQSYSDEIFRLRAAIKRIDAINDNPAHFSSEINEVCDAVLRPHLVATKQR